MKKIKKLTSVFLAVIMALGVLTVAPFTVSAASISDVTIVGSNYANYLDEVDIIESKRYTGNEGDSFVDKIGKNYYTRGNEDINGNKYSHGIEGWIARWNYEKESSWAYSIFNLDGKYKEVNGKCVLIKSYNTYNFDTTLAFYGDGKLLKSYQLTPQTIPFNVNLNLSGIKTLKVYFYDNIAVKGGTSFGLTNMSLKPNYPPNSVKLNRETLTLGVGEKYGLIKTVSPSSANQSCTWSSSNSSIASVDSNGKVTAKKSGWANITVKTSNGKTATCKVTVKPAPTSVKVNPASLTLGKGETYTISQSTNSGSYAWGFSWSSSNTSVATVTKGSANKATVTAKGVGTATIKIKTYNGKTATCKVTVKNAPTSVKTTPTSVTLGKGEKYTISENTNSGAYANATNLKWSTTNSNVATVTKGSANKATITAKGVGTAYIKITLYNGKTAQCKVTVKNAPSSVKTNPTSVTIFTGEKYTISESTNSGSYANAANLKWSTSNSNVATITKGSGNKAVITAKGAGTAYVKITLFNGKTATCKVTVLNATRVNVGEYTVKIPSTMTYEKRYNEHNKSSDLVIFDKYNYNATGYIGEHFGRILTITRTASKTNYDWELEWRSSTIGLGYHNGYYYYAYCPSDVRSNFEGPEIYQKKYDESFALRKYVAGTVRFN